MSVFRLTNTGIKSVSTGPLAYALGIERTRACPVPLSMSGRESFLVDCWNDDSWDQLIRHFPGGNVYQNGRFGSLQYAGRCRRVSRAALLRDGKAVAAAQIAIKGLPTIGLSVADSLYGPLWNSHDLVQGSADLGCFLDHLIAEYVGRRRLPLRLAPPSTFTPEGDRTLTQLFLNHGLTLDRSLWHWRTIVIDLSQSLDEIRKGFRNSGRRHLKRSGKSGLQITTGTSLELFQRFHALYREMYHAKRFRGDMGIHVPTMEELHRRLPEAKRFTVTVASDDAGDIGATVCTRLGDTTVYFLGASSPTRKRECLPGYLLTWYNIVAAKEQGSRWFDFGGLSDTSAALNRFKESMGGRIVEFPGMFHRTPATSFATLYRLAEGGYRGLRQTWKQAMG